MSNTEIVTPTSIEDVYEDNYNELVSYFKKEIVNIEFDLGLTLDEIKLAFEEAAYNLTQEGENE